MHLYGGIFIFPSGPLVINFMEHNIAKRYWIAFTGLLKHATVCSAFLSCIPWEEVSDNYLGESPLSQRFLSHYIHIICCLVRCIYALGYFRNRIRSWNVRLETVAG